MMHSLIDRMNPIAPTRVLKVLRSILQAENKRLNQDVLMQIADGCGGDLRAAIITLQAIACSPTPRDCIAPFSNSSSSSSSSSSSKRKPSSRRSKKSTDQAAASATSSVTTTTTNTLATKARDIGFRDQNYQVFHALGKIFYNKRMLSSSACVAHTLSFCNTCVSTVSAISVASYVSVM
jgi:DNA polymerase III delta prime subunit